MFPNPFFNMGGMGGPFAPGMNTMGMPGAMPGFMPGQGMPGQALMPGQGMPVSQGDQDMGPPGGGGGGGGTGGGRQGKQDNSLRGRVCLKFMQTGSCSYGDTCKYAHVRDGNVGGQDRGEQGGRGGKANPRKVRLCEKFMTLGFCPYGDKCCFAHGEHELRQGQGRDQQQAQQQQHSQIMFPQQQGQQPQAPDGLPPALVPKPAPPAEPYPGTAKAQGGAAGAPKPPGGQPDAGPTATTAPAAATAPSSGKEVTFVDKVRALCGVLNIGNAAVLAKEKPLALQTAAMSLRNANAFKENPFADSVERYIVQAAQS